MFNASRLKLKRVAVIAAALAAALMVVPAIASAELPVSYSITSGFDAYGHPEMSPPGSNDWACQLTAAHPRPVVLVHATLADQGDNWGTLSPLLKNNGYCVFSFTYGETAASNGKIFGIGPVRDGAAELSSFVDQVLAATGVAKVDMVGHSQGGMMPNYYIKFLGGAAKTKTLVALGPTNHGTTLDGLLVLAHWWNVLFPPDPSAPAVGSDYQGLLDQEYDSEFIQELNSVPDTVPGVNYTVIATMYDKVVTPYRSAFLSGGGGTIKNITIQDKCALDFTGHVSLAFDHVALNEVLNALDPAHAHGTSCTPVWPLIGG
ncbi:MAG: alpha/beta fold hydrolase [Thermoleophilaceae bacterium]|nr:alpha/beta fold hydrolase [Thermoleophilaceae bacterium]